MVRLPDLRDVSHPAVRDALQQVPRHRFVPRSQLSLAYADRALAIGHGQTVSQPYIVAKMTECLDPRPGMRILEIGTGSGYQAAVLAALRCEVYSIEIIPELGQQAARVLQQLGYENVHLRIGDGQAGWLAEAPFDGILLTAAAPRVPAALRTQLREGGRLVAPIGRSGQVQQLICFTRQGDEFAQRGVLPVRFVPLTGGRLSFLSHFARRRRDRTGPP